MVKILTVPIYKNKKIIEYRDYEYTVKNGKPIPKKLVKTRKVKQ